MRRGHMRTAHRMCLLPFTGKISPAVSFRGDIAMNKTIHGIVHGKTIELDEELGVADGQEVEVSVKIVQAKGKWGEGILRSAGALANDDEWDAIMKELMKPGRSNDDGNIRSDTRRSGLRQDNRTVPHRCRSGLIEPRPESHLGHDVYQEGGCGTKKPNAGQVAWTRRRFKPNSVRSR